MYTLRIIHNSNLETNIALGNYYSLIRSNCEKYDELIKLDKLENEIIDGFILSELNTTHIPIYNRHKNYIMSNNGRTFAKL